VRKKKDQTPSRKYDPEGVLGNYSLNKGGGRGAIENITSQRKGGWPNIADHNQASASEGCRKKERQAVEKTGGGWPTPTHPSSIGARSLSL